MQYLALLRGINVGGKTVSMAELKKTFEQSGCRTVRTVLNSGNVLLVTDEPEKEKLTQTIEAALVIAFGFPVTVLLRTEKEIRDLLEKDPFRHIAMTPTMRLNVTFLETPSQKHSMSEGDLRIIAQYSDTICTAVDLTSGKGTVDMMAMLEKTYGKNITTRTWTTVQRIGKLLA